VRDHQRRIAVPWPKSSVSRSVRPSPPKLPKSVPGWTFGQFRQGGVHAGVISPIRILGRARLSAHRPGTFHRVEPPLGMVGWPWRGKRGGRGEAEQQQGGEATGWPHDVAHVILVGAMGEGVAPHPTDLTVVALARLFSSNDWYVALTVASS